MLEMNSLFNPYCSKSYYWA